ncbi:unnamed protein product [Closterium sp. NIES-53]
MDSRRVLALDHEGRPVQFDTWLDDLQLYLLSDSKDNVSLFDLASGAAPAPLATTDSRLLLPYLFPELSAFATKEDLVSHLRTSNARYRTTVSAEFLDRNQPPMFMTLYFIVTRLPDSLRSVRDHFFSLDPTSLTVDLLEQHLLAAETSAVAVGAARSTPRPPFFEGCSPSPLAPSYASATAANVPGAEDVGAASASAKSHNGKGKGSKGGGGGSGNGGGGSSGGGGGSGGGGSGGSGGGGGGVGGGGGGSSGSGGGGTGGGGTGARRGGPGRGQRQQQQRRSETQSPQQLLFVLVKHAGSFTLSTAASPASTTLGVLSLVTTSSSLAGQICWSRIAIFDLDFDAILSAMHSLSVSAEGDCYRCVPPDPGIVTAALGASESGTLPGTSPAKALHTFTLDSDASRCFFRDSTTPTPLPAPVLVRLADPSGGPVVARSSTVLPCLAVPSSSLSGLHLPSFSTNLVSTAALQDVMVTTTTPGGSSLYTIATEPPQVAASAQVSASGQVAPPCSCPLLSHQALLWHHRLGHPSLPRLRGMHSRLLVSGLPRSLPPLPPSHAPPFLPCVKGRQRAAPHSSSFLHDCSVADSPLGQVVSSPPTSCGNFFRGEGILQSFTLPDSPQQNGIAERRIGLVMEVARTSMIHAAAPHFLWPFAVRYAAHQLNLWPRVFLPETSHTLRWTGEVGNASVFRFYHPTSRRVIPSQDGTFDESVPFYCLFHYRSAPPPPPSLFLAPALGSGAAPGATSRGAASGGAEPGGAGSEGAGSEGAEPGGEEPGGTEPEGVEPGGAESEGAECWGAEPWGAASSGGPAGASLRLSPQQLREWLVQRARLRSGAPGAGGAEDAGAGGAGVTAGAGGPGGNAAAGPGGARTRGTGAVGAGGPGGSCPPPVPGTHAMALRPSSVPLRVPLLAPPESSLPEVPNPESDRARAACPTVTRLLATANTDPSFESSAASALVAELLDFAAACRLKYTTALVAESVSASLPFVGGECALGTDVLDDRQRWQWQAAMDAEMASWKSTGTYVDEVPPPGANIFDGMRIFRRDYELHSLDFSTTFLQGSLHEEIWLRRPPGFTESFPACTQWSLWRPVYGLRQAPREWHDTLRTTLAALGSAPATADPSLFLRTDTSLPPFYVLIYVDDLVFAIADSEALTLVNSELQKRHTCTDLGPSALRLPVLLATTHSSVYQPLALSSTFGRVLGRAWGSCLEDGVQLSSPVTQTLLGSSCEAEIYTGAMAAQELRWLTYLLTDLGEKPRSPLVLYVDNKAMIALCQEHRTKHIALRYFLARELQQCGQLRLAYVATRANTTDILTKALPAGDH